MANPVAKSLSFDIPDTDWRWVGLALLISTFLGLALMVVPVHTLIVLLLALAAVVWLALNPVKLFYLVIFTIPFTDRVRILPVSFSANDLVIFYCAVVALAHWLLREQRVSLKTGLDGWIIVLTGLFFMAGLTSQSDTGLLGFFKVFEAFVVYYLVVYFIRTRQMSRAGVLKVVLWTALSQALLGTFQSLTGIGADFESNRGYLGYLGLGSSHVWHGRGTTWHFNTLGNYLVANLLVLLPFYLYAIRRKQWALICAGLLMMGIITTYSRGSLLGLASGILFLVSVIQPNFRRVVLFAGAFLLLVIAPVVLVFGNSSYVETISFNERLVIWEVPLAAITSSAKSFWFGSGLNAYQVVAWPHIPGWVPPDQYRNWFAHNFYLLTVLEMGVIGAFALFGFMVYIWLDTWRKFKQQKGFVRILSLSISVTMVTVFFVSIFDHTFGSPHFKVFVFLLLAMLYVRRSGSERKRYA